MFRILKRKCLEWKQGTNIWPIIESDLATLSISILKYNSKRVINIFLSPISTSPYFWKGCYHVGEICWWQSMLVKKFLNNLQFSPICFWQTIRRFGSTPSFTKIRTAFGRQFPHPIELIVIGRKIFIERWNGLKGGWMLRLHCKDWAFVWILLEMMGLWKLFEE